MYKVLCDNALMCDSRIEELALLNPVVNLEENKAGSFSFTIPPSHPKYDIIQKRKTIVDVYQNDELIFSGMCIEASTDFYKQKKITCEGELTFFNDSIQRPAQYSNVTVRGLLEAYVANHNAQVEERKQFKVGIVTVTDSNNSISCYTNMESTMECLKEDLVDDLGGIIRIRHENGIRYIDYLADSPNTNSQTIKFGKNLMDFTSNIDSSDIATAIIPLGAQVEDSPIKGLETRLTIESVNGGADYVYSPEAVEAYGWIYKTVTFDSVTVPSNLKAKGEQYLSETQFENMVIEAKAIDLNLTDKTIERFKISDQIRVISAPHGLNKHFRLTKQTLNLNNPENNTITLGKEENVSLSAKANQASDEMKKAVAAIVPSSTILQDAYANATALITAAMGGYVVKTNDELLIMDTDNIETATKVWRWNINGLAYSSTGYNGTYKLAMTMDGQIVADFITAGILTGIDIRGGSLEIDTKEDYANDVIRILSNTHYLCVNSATMNIFWPEYSTVSSLGSQGLSLGTFEGSPSDPDLLPNWFGSSYGDSCSVNGNLTVKGTKSRLTTTEDYGDRLLYCYETPTPMFGDIGEGVIDETGKCYIFLDDIFAETIDTDCTYQVFLQAYGNGNCYVTERTSSYFVVEGTENLSFGWEVKAIQKEFDTMRLEEPQKAEQQENTASETYSYLTTLLYNPESEEI